MKKIYPLLLIATGLIEACGSHGGNPDLPPEDSQKVAEHIDPSTKFPAETIATDSISADKDFLLNARFAGQEAIALAGLALQRSGNAQVKNAAISIQKTYQKVLQSLNTVQNLSLDSSAKYTDSSREELSALPIKAFDQQWLNKMILKNDAAIRRFEIEKDASKDKGLLQVTLQGLPLLQKLKQDLEIAQGKIK